MNKIIVTSGQPFTDIDALACAVAYSQLLRLEGFESLAVLPGHLNNSVIPKIKRWNPEFVTKPPKGMAKYVLVDICDPEYFANFVKEKGIIEIFDHRPGLESYWEEKLGKKAKIEMVGSCATLIWEEFKKRKKAHKISKVNASLLYTAIISNTLNFQASVTTKRDIDASKELWKYADLSKNWVEIYFSDQNKSTDENIKKAILNDVKNLDPVIGQLELWDSRKIIFKHLKEIKEVLESFGNPRWFLTSPSISEGKNYLFTKNSEIKKLLTKILDAKFKGDIGTTKKLWLRKEILKKTSDLIV